MEHAIELVDNIVECSCGFRRELGDNEELKLLSSIGERHLILQDKWPYSEKAASKSDEEE